MRRRRPPLPDSIVLPGPLRRYRMRIVAVIVVLAVLAGERVLRSGATGSDMSRYHDRAFRVVKVVDGDTIDLDAPDGNKPFTRVRLWGVDAPEVAHGADTAMHYGVAARNFAEESLLNAEVHVVLVPLDTRDKYGRLLAFVEPQRGGVMFNELLIERGYAYADPRFDHPYKERFTAMEKRARKQGVGLWADLKPSHMPAWRQRKENKGLARNGP